MTAAADVDSLRPGQTFHLVARFTMAPGWHIYWKNPGDSGLPTRLSATVPEGFTTAPEPLYPTPHRFTSPGNIVSYGYEKETALFLPVTAPSSINNLKSFEFSIHGSWLMCKDVCIPGSGEARVDVPASPTPSSPVSPALPPELEAFRSRIPKTMGDLPSARWTWEGPTLVVTVGGASEGEWFPLAPAEPRLPAPVVTVDGSGFTLRLTVDPAVVSSKSAERRAGVIRVRQGGVERFAELVLPETPSGLPVP